MAGVGGEGVSRRVVLEASVAVLVVFGAMAALAGAPRSVVAQGRSFDCAPIAGRGAATPGAVAASTPAVTAEVGFPAEGGDLTVFAAASLTDAFEAIGEDLEGANRGLEISFNFGGSQTLVTQLAEGAEADVFASANDTQMDAAIANGSVVAKALTFARNELAIVVPLDNPAGIAEAADIGAPGVTLVLAQADVPVGRYARESVCSMSRSAGTFGEGFVERVAENIVSEEEDVRGVLTRVRLGEADAGIVYASAAAAAAEEVTLIEIPAEFNLVATYPIAPVGDGDEALARAFIAYLLGEEGQATLVDFGFQSVDG